MSDFTFEIKAAVDSEDFEIVITVPDSLRDISHAQAAAMIRLLNPNAQDIKIHSVMCQY